MGASRKLQGEIDRVLKKVQEGVDVFDSIWNKVYDTDNANQKEKFEADLKKEIKKLQRYRDQIKTWIQSSEIKDKKVSASYEQALLDARKLIEREMERFKICEKETKTKAFSKEGLGQQPKTDPKEKAKSETRDWLNTVVGELECQVDNFEAEIEGLSVKKGKTRPPRLTHLETSIARHKAHIMKLELILRLLDNDELSPEQVNDVKDFLDDYVERNQEDFEEFSDVDELYNSLPLDKVESLEDLVTIGAPGLVKGAPALSLKNSLTPTQIPATVTSPLQQSTSIPEQSEETASQDSNSEIGPRTPPAKNSVIGSSASSTPTGSHATPIPLTVSAHNLSASPAPTILPSSTSVRGVLENAGTAISSPVNVSSSAKEEEIASFPGRRSSPALVETGLVRGIGRGVPSSQPSTSVPLSSGITIPSNGGLGAVPSASDMSKRSTLGADERLGGGGMVQPLVSPLSNRMILPQTAKTNDGTGLADSSSVGEAAVIAGRVFSPSVVPGMQWRPGSSFQNQNESGQFRGRTEITLDQKEKFLQRLQQVQQQTQSTILGMPPLSGGNHKQFSAQQQNPLLQQFNSQSSSVSPQVGLGLGVQAPSLNTVTSAAIQQQPGSIHQQSNQQALLSTGPKDADVGHVKAEDQQQQQNVSDDSTMESAPSSLGKNLMNEDDLKASYAMDTSAGVSGSLTEPSQVPRDTDLSPGQPVQSNQPSGSLGVIGRRSISDLGAIGDTLSGSAVNSGGMHDQLYNLQMLEAAFYKLPQPKDSERARNYTPRHPAVTPPSYPQVQAPIVNNPAFWERLGLDTFGTDTLFFAFYYQQNTYQQYLAAKELKKQSWRYHRKYNTWFQRHEEPKVATDEFEQGTYVYFDFHIANDDLQHGWCQRIKTEFTFEYNYLEDELIV
ncbi:CCR4-NOT transcription complex subunit 3 isoform X1 [Vitis riparia]|uniref:CCR4-NOT transcription complex subunit 3 isoform X1 n=1 Tax=Vitis riparia TaxID=96939 RepID=UPI00155A61BF|nr:CCR4-NOT transcription complex subunit 3 isoform X1 [Vitis riparia]XP_034693419.1 CCR4-NOT transcription complex subunit 3 isoform X1 [Vitis riparia]XP_034693420.1 CCR4-NOT transcription complex subunit 3 isoform X1 [Vitis riparia]